MRSSASETAPRPPLMLLWRSETNLSQAVAGLSGLYGVGQNGHIVAVDGGDGSIRWMTAGQYLPNHLVCQGNRLFAFKVGEGLASIDDDGSSPSEQLWLSFGATPSASICDPILDDRLLYLVVNKGLYCLHQDQGLQYAAILNEDPPHTAGFVASNQFVVIDGAGIPTRYHARDTEFDVIWRGSPNGVNAGYAPRPSVITSGMVVIGINDTVVAYRLADGHVAWKAPGVRAESMVADGSVVYAAFRGGSLWAFRAADGATLWHRQYLYRSSLLGAHALAQSGEYLFCGGLMLSNPDGANLIAVRKDDGAFVWLSRAVTLPWAGGFGIVDGSRIYVFGGSHTGAFRNPSTEPRVRPENVTVTPRPIRGPGSGFGTGTVEINLPVSERISIAPYREQEGIGAVLADRADWAAGHRQVSWAMGGGGGFTDTNQFGFMQVDVEDGVDHYTQSVLLPVNTFPDIVDHWAQTNIEVMVYWKYVNGYDDQLFRPDALVTRAESSTIVAKTLNLQSPSPGFHSKFTDIGGHWARPYIEALEERGVVGGFAEPDGTFTFRPDLTMTRAEEAMILVRAYAVPPAPAGFSSRFSDIAGHWAESDIKALEAAGYVNGFQEPDGTFTYRPEQNLTRAEMCTIIVRIRNLAR